MKFCCEHWKETFMWILKYSKIDSLVRKLNTERNIILLLVSTYFYSYRQALKMAKRMKSSAHLENITSILENIVSNQVPEGGHFKFFSIF